MLQLRHNLNCFCPLGDKWSNDVTNQILSNERIGNDSSNPLEQLIPIQWQQLNLPCSDIYLSTDGDQTVLVLINPNPQTVIKQSPLQLIPIYWWWQKKVTKPSLMWIKILPTNGYCIVFSSSQYQSIYGDHVMILLQP